METRGSLSILFIIAVWFTSAELMSCYSLDAEYKELPVFQETQEKLHVHSSHVKELISRHLQIKILMLLKRTTGI